MIQICLCKELRKQGRKEGNQVSKIMEKAKLNNQRLKKTNKKQAKA